MKALPLKKNLKKLDGLGIDIANTSNCCRQIDEDEEEEEILEETKKGKPQPCPTISSEKKDSNGSFMDSVLQQIGVGAQ